MGTVPRRALWGCRSFLTRNHIHEPISDAQSHPDNMIGGDSIQRRYRPDPNEFMLTAWRLHWGLELNLGLAS